MDRAGAYASPIYLRNIQADPATALPSPGGTFGTVTGDPTTVCCHGAFTLSEQTCSSTPDCS